MLRQRADTLSRSLIYVCAAACAIGAAESVVPHPPAPASPFSVFRPRYPQIDNLVQIGHNVRIGRNCLICGQAGLAGSATLGDFVTLGGRAAVADHVSVCSQARTRGHVSWPHGGERVLRRKGPQLS